MWTQIHTFIDNNPMKTKATVYMEKTCKVMCVGGGVGECVRARVRAHTHTDNKNPGTLCNGEWPKIPLSSFCDSHLLLGMGLTLRMTYFLLETPLEKTVSICR